MRIEFAFWRELNAMSYSTPPNPNFTTTQSRAIYRMLSERVQSQPTEEAIPPMDELKQKALEAILTGADFEPARGGLEWYRKRDGCNVSLRGDGRFFLMGSTDALPSLLQQAPVLTSDARRSLEWFLRNATLDPVDPEAGGHHQTLKDFLSRSSQGVTMEQVEKAVSVVNARRHATYTDYVCDILKELGIPVEGAG